MKKLRNKKKIIMGSSQEGHLLLRDLKYILFHSFMNLCFMIAWQYNLAFVPRITQNSAFCKLPLILPPSLSACTCHLLLSTAGKDRKGFLFFLLSRSYHAFSMPCSMQTDSWKPDLESSFQQEAREDPKAQTA